MTTRHEAMQDIVGMFLYYWGVDFVKVPGKDFTAPSDRSQQWAEVDIEHTDGAQASLAGADGSRRWRRSGVCTISLYFPVTGDLGPINTTAEEVEQLYQGKRSPNDVWFRGVRTIEDKTYTTWYKLDVFFLFEYDNFS